MDHCLEQHQSLKPFSLTHVLYPKDNPIWGKAMALAALSPFALLTAYVAAFAARRSLVLLAALTGQLISEALNAVLKRWWRQARPSACLGKGYGMPSSHAQFSTFAATFLSLYVYQRVHCQSLWLKHLLILAMLLSGAFVAYSRISLTYHTTAQVLVGSSIGVICGIAWYGLIEGILRPLGLHRRLLSSSLGHWLSLRDDATIHNVWSQERQASLQTWSQIKPKSE
ncbi:MAG: hypothetical protein DHS80DRAFT_28968 [Piptocephalis tieghemiana]|nr:MAG: hypothetical protein DHS80DRAFT_28968 [Piptocephalis tieghemiana]